MTQTHISAEMRAAIGSELSRRVSYPVSESDIRRWAIAVYYPDEPPARFIDPAVAEKTHYGGIVAPEEFNAFAWLAAEETVAGKRGDDLNDPRRTEIGLGITPPDVRFMLNGGMEVEYGEPIRPGDVITSAVRLAGYREQAGRLGLMLFTVSADTWTNQHGDVVRWTRSTLIRYLPASEDIMATSTSPADAAVGDSLPEFTRTTDLGNWNRYAAVNDEFVPIHMDDEAGRAAGYPAAFGMGNLQWAYLHNLIRNWIGDTARIVSLSCQFRAPNTRGMTVTAHGVVVGRRTEQRSTYLDLDIWTESEAGIVLAPGRATVALF